MLYWIDFYLKTIIYSSIHFIESEEKDRKNKIEGQTYREIKRQRDKKRDKQTQRNELKVLF